MARVDALEKEPNFGNVAAEEDADGMANIGFLVGILEEPPLTVGDFVGANLIFPKMPPPAAGPLGEVLLGVAEEVLRCCESRAMSALLAPTQN